MKTGRTTASILKGKHSPSKAYDVGHNDAAVSSIFGSITGFATIIKHTLAFKVIEVISY